MPVIIVPSNNAAQTRRAAHEAHVERCKVELLTFQTRDSHNVQEMQSYAQCVELVYPVVDSRDIVAGKIVVAILLISAIIGAGVGCREKYDKLFHIAIFSFFGLCSGFVALVVATAIIYLLE